MEFVELMPEEYLQTEMPGENFLQSIEMYRRYQGMGREAYLIGLLWGQQLVIKGLVVATNWKFGQKIFRMAGGWMMSGAVQDARAVENLNKKFVHDAEIFCKDRGGMMLEVSPNLTEDTWGLNTNFKHIGEYGTPKWVYKLSLEGRAKEEIFANFRQNHRNLIRRTEREGVEVRELTDGELGVLKKLVEDSGEKHGFQDPDLTYYQSMKKAFGDKVKFAVAEQEVEGKMQAMAGAMFVLDGEEMVYLYSGSAKVHRGERNDGAYAIQWAMIQVALAWGCKRYNFYGTRPLEGDGVYRFKQGFRGEVVELVGTYVKPLNLIGKLYCSRLKYHKYFDVA